MAVAGCGRKGAAVGREDASTTAEEEGAHARVWRGRGHSRIRQYNPHLTHAGVEAGGKRSHPRTAFKIDRGGEVVGVGAGRRSKSFVCGGRVEQGRNAG